MLARTSKEGMNPKTDVWEWRGAADPRLTPRERLMRELEMPGRRPFEASSSEEERVNQKIAARAEREAVRKVVEHDPAKGVPDVHTACSRVTRRPREYAVWTSEQKAKWKTEQKIREALAAEKYIETMQGEQAALRHKEYRRLWRWDAQRLRHVERLAGLRGSDFGEGRASGVGWECEVDMERYVRGEGGVLPGEGEHFLAASKTSSGRGSKEQADELLCVGLLRRAGRRPVGGRRPPPHQHGRSIVGEEEDGGPQKIAVGGMGSAERMEASVEQCPTKTTPRRGQKILASWKKKIVGRLLPSLRRNSKTSSTVKKTVEEGDTLDVRSPRFGQHPYHGEGSHRADAAWAEEEEEEEVFDDEEMDSPGSEAGAEESPTSQAVGESPTPPAPNDAGEKGGIQEDATHKRMQAQLPGGGPQENASATAWWRQPQFRFPKHPAETLSAEQSVAKHQVGWLQQEALAMLTGTKFSETGGDIGVGIIPFVQEDAGRRWGWREGDHTPRAGGRGFFFCPEWSSSSPPHLHFHTIFLVRPYKYEVCHFHTIFLALPHYLSRTSHTTFLVTCIIFSDTCSISYLLSTTWEEMGVHLYELYQSYSEADTLILNNNIRGICLHVTLVGAGPSYDVHDLHSTSEVFAFT